MNDLALYRASMDLFQAKSFARQASPVISTASAAHAPENDSVGTLFVLGWRHGTAPI